MKRFIALVAAVLVLVGGFALLTVPAAAREQTTTATVTVTNEAVQLVHVTHPAAPAIDVATLTTYERANRHATHGAGYATNGGATYVDRDGQAPLSFPLLC